MQFFFSKPSTYLSNNYLETSAPRKRQGRNVRLTEGFAPDLIDNHNTHQVKEIIGPYSDNALDR